jgi:hypothetical protein
LPHWYGPIAHISRSGSDSGKITALAGDRKRQEVVACAKKYRH